ncbi:MAG: ThuA domain-containing protein [Tannerellaceae bacterium]|jgi:type 1 glutamine amidotransferase|nr:ThuA domain-containing protein [Tannerellaceae bacterium]
MKRFLFAAIAAFFFCTAAAAQTAKIKAMIITGQDGSHWWQGGSEAIKMILEGSGLFAVDILVTPQNGEPMDAYRPEFAKYDLVVINYGGATLVEGARKDFEQFVASGGGLVVIHSSIIPMEDWEEYNKMVGLGAWNGRDESYGPYVYWKDDRFVYDYSPGAAGYHGLQHPFTVVHRNTGHPITKGLPVVWEHFKDELYARLRGPARGLDILATAYETVGGSTGGRDEPVMWTVPYGKGRVFVTVLGHAGNDPELRYSMECTGFQVTLLRGAEWAVRGTVTQDVPKDFPSKGVFTFRPDFKAPFNAY